MNDVDFLSADRYLILDGSMGAMLLRHGVALGAVPEEANLTSPQTVRRLHAAYRAAGAGLVETLTLGANALTLKDKGCQEKLEALVTAAVGNARTAVGDEALVALSAGPTGRMPSPLGDTLPREFFRAYLAQMKAGKEAGADLAFLETHNDLTEARLGALAAKAAGLPFILSFTMEGNSTMMGNSSAACAVVAERLGALAVGVNCVGDPESLYVSLKEMASSCRLPLTAMPNAGKPELLNGKSVYPLTPEQYLEWMRPLLPLGVTGLGGCCGTGPEHIALLPSLVEGIIPPKRPDIPALFATPRTVFPLREALERPLCLSIAPGADPYLVEDEWMEAADPTCLRLDVTRWDDFPALEEYLPQALSAVPVPVVFVCASRAQAESALLSYGGTAGLVLPGAAEIAAFYGAIHLE